MTDSRHFRNQVSYAKTFLFIDAEYKKSDAVKTLERSHGLMPEVCYFSVTQTASILGLSWMSVYRMIYDGRLKATRLSSSATRISREDIETTMVAQRLFSPADFYTFNDILKMTGRSRSGTFNFLRRNGITHTCHSRTLPFIFVIRVLLFLLVCCQCSDDIYGSWNAML